MSKQGPSQPPGPNSTDLDEEMRAFFQRRLAFVYGVIGGVMTFALTTSWILYFTHLFPARAHAKFPRMGLVFVAIAAAAALAWRWCRRGRRSQAALNRLDAFGLLVLIYAFLAVTTSAAVHQVGEIGYMQLLMVNFFLIGRAIGLPSSGRRTLKLALAATIPATVAATYVRVTDPTLPEEVVQTLFTMGRPMAVTTVLAYLASRVIFGLRQQVRAATKIGQYLLHEKIGEGGMGVVYRATHAMLRRETAVKLLWPDRVGEAHLARFEREVTLTARLTHPNTIAIFDYGRTPDGVFYYTMEYLDGLSLEELVELDGPLPPARVVHFLRQACGALAEAHGTGLIHRDVKPANVLVCERGGIPDHVKVLDFGLVKDLAVAVGSADVSRVGALIGTPLYMAPEAIMGREDVDARADLYGLGALGYFLLTGSPPFRGPSVAEVCGQHLHAAVEAPSQRLGRPVPAELEQVLLRCLEKKREDRPPSAVALGKALAACREVGAWNEEDAARWWADRGAALRKLAATRSRRADGSLPSKRTIAVELGGRAAAGG